jgi:hypothetical protein
MFTANGYLKTVKSIAEECQTEYPDPDDDARHDYIHESVDGNQYVIYYSANEVVLETSANEPDGAEVREMTASDADWRQMRVVAAFMAMEADVREALERLDEQADTEAA